MINVLQTFHKLTIALSNDLTKCFEKIRNLCDTVLKITRFVNNCKREHVIQSNYSTLCKC